MGGFVLMSRKGCSHCQSKDPEWLKFVAVQTACYLCCQSFDLNPTAGVARHFLRAVYPWWRWFR